jgi:hypothetical protein
MVAFLANRSFAVVIFSGAAIEESVYYSAGVKQLRNETEMGTPLGHRQRTRRRGIEVGPLGRYEGATSVGQNQNSDVVCSDAVVAQRPPMLSPQTGAAGE